jgi:hypothetical protein
MHVPSKSEILAARKREWLPVPSWGPDAGVFIGDIGTRGLLAIEELRSREDVKAGGHSAALQAELLALIAVFACQKEDGTLAFGPDDVGWLQSEPLDILAKISDTAMRLSGLTAGEQDGAEKN